MSTAEKIRTGAALVVVFLLVMATNMVDSNHFKIVKKSLTTVYEDRLVAKVYLYKISRQLQLKKDALYFENPESIAKINNAANDSIQALIKKFSRTELTGKEADFFQSLQKNLNQLYNNESKLSKGESIDQEVTVVNEVERYYTPIFEDLDELSKIQLTEGKRQVVQSNRAIGSSDLISRIEIGILILIGVLIQMLIFLKPMK